MSEVKCVSHRPVEIQSNPTVLPLFHLHFPLRLSDSLSPVSPMSLSPMRERERILDWYNTCVAFLSERTDAESGKGRGDTLFSHFPENDVNTSKVLLWIFSAVNTVYNNITVEPGSSQDLKINFGLKGCFNRRITIEIGIKYKNKNEFHRA
jgi:hypothetical protein